MKFIDHLQVFSLLAKRGRRQSRSSCTRLPPRTPSSAEELAEQNITPSTIRLSIGTENAEGYHLGSEAGLRRAGRVKATLQGPLATR